ncbi:MAG: Hpt domain-containing protein [Phycisphaerales bacterium]|jgi:HPt (histidine-containing phosphotransfer) domain-containing protein
MSTPTPTPNASASPTAAGGPPVRSQFSSDPEMRELVMMFVEELPQRMQALTEALKAQQWDVVHRISHQLKGASAGYGFPTVGTAAAKVEDVVKAGPITTQQSLTQLVESVNQLTGLCKRVVA